MTKQFRIIDNAKREYVSTTKTKNGSNIIKFEDWNTSHNKCYFNTFEEAKTLADEINKKGYKCNVEEITLA